MPSGLALATYTGHAGNRSAATNYPAWYAGVKKVPANGGPAVDVGRLRLTWKARGENTMTVPTLTAIDGLQREEILRKLGGNIRRERVMRLMSQDWLAAKAGLNVHTIAKIEAGELNVRSQTIERIRAAIGCPFSRLLGMTPEAGENELRVAIAQLQFLKKLCAPDVTTPRRRCLSGTNNFAITQTKRDEPK